MRSHAAEEYIRSETSEAAFTEWWACQLFCLTVYSIQLIYGLFKLLSRYLPTNRLKLCLIILRDHKFWLFERCLSPLYGMILYCRGCCDPSVTFLYTSLFRTVFLLAFVTQIENSRTEFICLELLPEGYRLLGIYATDVFRPAKKLAANWRSECIN